jgi:hypothetical protein
MTDDTYSPKSSGLRLAADEIARTMPGDIIQHPQGYLVELVACYHDHGYYFWFRVDEETLSRTGTIEGGTWGSASVSAKPDGNPRSLELKLLEINQARRNEIIAQMQKLHDEMTLLLDINNVLYGNVLSKGKGLL